MAGAADIVMGETGSLPHLPQLPERGLGSDLVGRTAGLLEAVNVDRGPRSWQMTSRPQILTRRTWDRWERDLDAIAEVWGEDVPRIKVQMAGPWTMAAAVELANGHRVITDRGARNDLYEALLMAAEDHKQAIARRFRAEVVLQLDEPLVRDVLAGKLSGTTDFDTIRAVPAEVVHGALEKFGAEYLNLTGIDPDWEVARAAKTVAVDLGRLKTAEHIDGLGGHLDAGFRVACAMPAGQPRASAIEIAAHCDRMGLPRELLTHAVDVVPWTVTNAPVDYAWAAQTADMLVQDAGDL